MTIDISKIQVGDTVTLGPFEVTRRDATSGYVSVRIGGGNCAFDVDQIASHTPQPRELKVGDGVKWDGSYGTIEHVARGKARVLFDDGSDDLLLVTSLTLVDPNQ